MNTKIESEFPSSTPNDESDGDETLEPNYQATEEEEEEEEDEDKIDFTNLVARLQSSGAIIKKPTEYHCLTCDIDFVDWEKLENHLITHVSLPIVLLNKLHSDEEDLPPSGDENWSDEEDAPPDCKPIAAKAPQNIEISEILKKTGLSLKKTVTNPTSSDSALNKLSGLGFTIKKNSTPIKKEKPDSEPERQNDVMQKLGKLGGIKLKLKSDGNNTNSFKVVNGLKDFQASDDEEEGSANEEEKYEQQSNDGHEKSTENEGENDSDEQCDRDNRKSSDSNESDKSGRKVLNLPKGVQAKLVIPKKEPVSIPSKGTPLNTQQEENLKIKPGRPAIKQTPKRGANEIAAPKEPQKAYTPVIRRQSHKEQMEVSPPRIAEIREINELVDNVVVKQEVQETVSNVTQNNDLPIFSSQIKSERSTPPLSERSTPLLASVKADPDATISTDTQSLFDHNNRTNSATPSLLPVTKTEDTSVTVIEINGDSNDEDDDCCVVSTTPAPDIKPKLESLPQPPAYPTPPSYSTSQTSYNTTPTLSSRLTTAPSTEKQHNFNWNAPDSKPPLDILEKSADDMFNSLLSTATKKECSLSDASEYVSLDSLGPQHTCDVCNTRFTNISLLEEHRRVTGHCSSIMTASPSSSLMPYNHSSNLLSSLLPVKQLAEQVGKLSTISSGGSGFTHQQNVMINIQAYPGAGGVMVPPQPYNSYGTGQGMSGNYAQPPGNMYNPPGQPMSMSNQYPGSNYMGQGYGQYPSPMSKPGYPGTMPPNSYSMASSPYSSASPLQNMQQSVYGQSPMMSQPGAMGPPGSSPSHPYAPASSPGGAMKAQTGSSIKIQNIQTFPPGQMIGQPTSGQAINSAGELGPGQMVAGQTISGPTPIRMAAGANITGSRPRMPSVRGQRPTIRPGIQVHGQVRGGKIGPRMPLKRPGAMMGGPGVQKRRTDMLLPGKHDNDDCQVMSLQKQREGLPLIHSVQGAKDKLSLGGQISITKKPSPVNKEASAMANVLASRGISVKQKQKSRSPTPERPLPHIPNLGAGVSIKHTSKSSKFSIPEARVGSGMISCKICKKMFMNHTSLQVHMSNAHPQTTSKIPVFKCDECPASYPKSLQLQHHKRVFHNVTGPNRELGLPVVDLSQEDNLKRLSNLGIYSFIPLANREQANGCFGIPVISVHNMQNGLSSSLQALGADGLLSLGPLKPLPNT